MASHGLPPTPDGSTRSGAHYFKDGVSQPMGIYLPPTPDGSTRSGAHFLPKDGTSLYMPPADSDELAFGRRKDDEKAGKHPSTLVCVCTVNVGKRMGPEIVENIIPIFTSKSSGIMKEP
jgi:hypothetical protein